MVFDISDKMMGDFYATLADMNRSKLKRFGVTYYRNERTNDMIYRVSPEATKSDPASEEGKIHYKKLLNNLIDHAGRTDSNLVYSKSLFVISETINTGGLFPMTYTFRNVAPRARSEGHRDLDELIISGDSDSINNLTEAAKITLSDYKAKKKRRETRNKQLDSKVFEYALIGAAFGAAAGLATTLVPDWFIGTVGQRVAYLSAFSGMMAGMITKGIGVGVADSIIQEQRIRQYEELLVSLDNAKQQL